MTDHRIVSQKEWLEERMHLLAKEKEFTRARDQLSEGGVRLGSPTRKKRGESLAANFPTVNSTREDARPAPRA